MKYPKYTFLYYLNIFFALLNLVVFVVLGFGGEFYINNLIVAVICLVVAGLISTIKEIEK